MKQTKKKRKKSVSYYKRIADKAFSEFIRKQASDNWGRASCFTCDVRKPWKELQAGHYVSRSHNSLRYDERNVQVQCSGCNIFKYGNMDEYALRLQEKYGKGILEELRLKKREIKNFKVSELEEIIKLYSGKYRIKNI